MNAKDTIALLMMCLAGTPQAAFSAVEVADVFNVGNNVYVRSLAYERATDALWVGTSTGALKISLADQSVQETFTRKDGLANEYVFAINIDRRGNKWFGTNGGGASMYRNGEWKVFMPINGLADYWVYAFQQQRTNDLVWIGTWAGANSYNLETGNMRTYVDELINEWVYALAVDSKDRVWFGTEGGISRFDGASWISWTHEEDGIGAPNDSRKPASANTGLGTRNRHDLDISVQGRETYNPGYIFSLLIEPDDTVWAGTWGGGVAHFDGTEWQNFTTEDGLSGNVVYAIAREANGTLWFGTNRGLTRYDGTTWTRFGHADGLPGRHFYTIAITADDNVWAGTRGAVVRMAETQNQDSDQ